MCVCVYVFMFCESPIEKILSSNFDKILDVHTYVCIKDLSSNNYIIKNIIDAIKCIDFTIIFAIARFSLYYYKI